MKFDCIIGNPPYQDETIGDNDTYAPPIYHKFMDEAYKIGHKVMLITPARFLFNAGSTPKDWNEKMLSDPHFKVLKHEQDSSKVFANTDIKGGVAIHYRDDQKECGAIEVFTAYEELNKILKKVEQNPSFKTLCEIVFSRTACRLTPLVHSDYPNALSCLSNGHPYDMSSNIFTRLPWIFSNESPNDGKKYIKILGREENRRVYKFIRRDYVNTPKNLDKYKVLIAGANGCGAFGETLSAPIIGIPMIGNTESFFSIGAFETKIEAENCLKYVKTKFARTLLDVLKITQAITPEKWKYVPLQDFTASSDIDWEKTISEIDRQLYAKYGLEENEIAFIESKVRAME